MERLIGAILPDQYEDWINGVRYFEMDEFWDWRKENSEIVENQKKIMVIS